MTDDSTSNYDTATAYDRVTAADIADFTRHLAELRYGQPRAGDPAERAIFLARKADLLARIAAQHTCTDPDYAEHILQLARSAHAAARQTRPRPDSCSNRWGQLTENSNPAARTRWRPAR